jgi:DNA mismatch repair protein MSH5
LLQVGFLVRVEGRRMTADVEEYLPDYQYAFEDTSAEGAGMYYRCSRTHDLQSEFGDMLHRIHDLEVPCSIPSLALT